MIRIGCIFNHNTVVGGGEISFIDLAASLTSAEISPVAIVPGKGEVAERLERLGIQVVETVFPRLTPLSLLFWYKRVRHLSRTFQALTLNLIHVNGARGMLYAGPAARRAGIPCVWHNRVLDRDPLLDRFRGHFADAVIANSKAVAQSLQKAGISNVSVVYNGFSIDALKKAQRAELHREYQIAPGVPIILAVGRLCAWKGFDDLLEACGLLSQKNVPYFCMILGKSAPDEKRHVAALLERKERLGLNNVHFAGWRDDVAAFRKAAAILAVPSHAEPFGRIVVEAWACGLPVVATNAAGPAEIIRHDENGVLVPPKNPQALADALAKLLADPLKRRSLAAAGLSSASDFTLEWHRDAVVALYRTLIKKYQSKERRFSCLESPPTIPPPGTSPVPVSVILITKNRHAKAEAAVRSVLGCDYDPAKREIVVIEETERPESIAGEGVRYLSIPCKNLGFAHARNIGIAHASHDLCAFIDDDCIADRGWLSALVGALTEHPEAGAVGGAVRVGACGAIGKCENILGFPGGGMLYVHQAKCAVVNRPTFSTCNCIVRKKTLIAAGGFDERCRGGGEDEMLSLAMGRHAAILFSPHAIVYHEPRDGLGKVFNWFVRRGKARIANLSLYASPGREIKTILLNSPFLRLAGVILIALALSLPLLPVLALLGTGYYAAMLWRYRWSLTYYMGYTLLFVPVVKAIMDIGYDAGLFAAAAFSNKKNFFSGNGRANE